MMRRLIEYSAIMVRIDASSCRMFSRTFSQPVTRPAPQASHGFQPPTMSTAATAPPSGKLPSAVRSGQSSTRNEIHTPSATSAKMRPISSAPISESMDMGRALPENSTGATRAPVSNTRFYFAGVTSPRRRLP